MRVLRCPFCNHEVTADNKLWGHYGRCRAAQASPLSREEQRGLMLEALQVWYEASPPSPPTPKHQDPNELEKCLYCDYRGTPAQILGHCGRRHLDKMQRKPRPTPKPKPQPQLTARQARAVNATLPPKYVRHPIERLWDTYRDGATARGHNWALTYEQFVALTSRSCVYCGALPKPSSVSRLPHNGVDRVDSTRGHEPDNCVPCCGRCNMMKGRLSIADFVEHCRRIVGFETARQLESRSRAAKFNPIKYRKDTKQY